jgi:hypothetical protein
LLRLVAEAVEAGLCGAWAEDAGGKEKRSANREKIAVYIHRVDLMKGVVSPLDPSLAREPGGSWLARRLDMLPSL